MEAPRLRTDDDATRWCRDFEARLGQEYIQLCAAQAASVLRAGRGVCRADLTTDGNLLVTSNVSGGVVVVPSAQIPPLHALALQLHSRG